MDNNTYVYVFFMNIHCMEMSIHSATPFGRFYAIFIVHFCIRASHSPLLWSIRRLEFRLAMYMNNIFLSICGSFTLTQRSVLMIYVRLMTNSIIFFLSFIAYSTCMFLKFSIPAKAWGCDKIDVNIMDIWLCEQ